METKAEQYFPTYKFEDRDILLLEFEEAQKIANGQTEVYGRVTNFSLAFVTFAFTISFGQAGNSSVLVNSPNTYLLFAIVLASFGAMLLGYFVDLQRQITINARKVVTLRTMLGVDYGHIHLTLPNWRVEGANNPFAIKFFEGWTNFKSMPFWLVVVSVNYAWWLLTKNNPPLHFETFVMNFRIDVANGHLVICLVYLYVFRSYLNDTHETNFLNLTKIFSSVVRIKLIDNFEYIIYRAKLSYLELERLNVNDVSLRKILIDIEDRRFEHHPGVSFRSLTRAFFSRFSVLRRRFHLIPNGGSTINMQLCRSLFIPANQNRYLRKIIEILLAFWVNREFSKEEILRLYIGSVRYERSVFGLASAVKNFFGEVRNKVLSNEEGFFLVERLSNVSSSVKWDRVLHLKSRTKMKIDIDVLRNIYDLQAARGKLVFS